MERQLRKPAAGNARAPGPHAAARKPVEVTNPLRVPNRAARRGWPEQNGSKAAQAWSVLHKKGAEPAGIRQAEALEEALCFGWIDSTSKAIDGRTYAQRFSPRRPGRNGAAGNRAAAERLIREGRMTKQGLRAFQRRAEGSPGEGS